MKKNLFSITFVLIMLFSINILAQNEKSEDINTQNQKDDENTPDEITQDSSIKSISPEPISPPSATKEIDPQLVEDLLRRVSDLENQLEKKIHSNLKAEQTEDPIDYDEIQGLLRNMRINGPKNSYLKIAGLFQSWIRTTQDAAPDGSWDTDFYLRRTRLMFYGQLNEHINFFIQTDNPNQGRNSNWSQNTYIQDAYAEFIIARALQINVGMLLPPFSRHGYQSAGSMLGLDYHIPLMRYPAGSNRGWRDAGIMLRGLLANDWLEYRVGIFNGVRGDNSDPRNPNDAPRLTSRLVLNFLEPEGGPGVGGKFTHGLHIQKNDGITTSRKKVFSLGFSLDWQANLNTILEPLNAQLFEDIRLARSQNDYWAMAWDLFWDIPFYENKMSLNGQVGFYYYDYGSRSSENAYYNTINDSSSYTGYGLFSEIGLRYRAIQPVFLLDFYNSTKASSDVEGDFVGIYGGLNYYLMAHAVTFKLQVGANKTNDDTWINNLTFQTQLAF